MAYLFDTDAISEVLRPRPAPAYLKWLAEIPREEQFTSAMTIAELLRGAYRSNARERHLQNIENRVLPEVSVLPFDVACARVWGKLKAELESNGMTLEDADVIIAATAVEHDLLLVTGNLKHFKRVPGLQWTTVLADAKTVT